MVYPAQRESVLKELERMHDNHTLAPFRKSKWHQTRLRNKLRKARDLQAYNEYALSRVIREARSDIAKKCGIIYSALSYRKSSLMMAVVRYAAGETPSPREVLPLLENSMHPIASIPGEGLKIIIEDERGMVFEVAINPTCVLASPAHYQNTQLWKPNRYAHEHIYEGGDFCLGSASYPLWRAQIELDIPAMIDVFESFIAHPH